MAVAVLLLDFFFRKKRKNCIQMEKQIKNPKLNRRNLTSKCRICLKQGEIEIFTEFSSENIAGDIKLFTRIKISKDDGLPKWMCTSCYNLLQSAILFRRMALETDKKIKNITQTKHKNRKTRKKRKRENSEEKFDEPDVKMCKEEIEMDNYHADDHDDSWREEKQLEEPEQYKCKKCLLEFHDSKEYLEHLKSVEHKAQKPKAALKRTTCSICHTSMVTSYLDTHMIRKHSDMKPFVCEVCGKGFPAQSGLKQHARIHSDDLPYKCQECPYRGRFSHSLRLHMRVHTGEKPYSCHICSTQFSFQTNFNKHMKSHKTDYDFKCEQCDRGFHSQKQMTEHVRIDHTGLKEHRCDICGKEFAYRKLMTKHTRVVHKFKKNPYKGRAPLYLQFDKKKQQDKENLDS